jgi:hypothetical protein
MYILVRSVFEHCPLFYIRVPLLAEFFHATASAPLSVSIEDGSGGKMQRDVVVESWTRHVEYGPFHGASQHDVGACKIRIVREDPGRLVTVNLPRGGNGAVSGETLTAVGYGVTVLADKCDSSDVLLVAPNIHLLNTSDCEEKNGQQPGSWYNGGILCTGNFLSTSPGDQTTCFGDSGGPLLAKRSGSWVQMGISSFITGRKLRVLHKGSAFCNPHRTMIALTLTVS